MNSIIDRNLFFDMLAKHGITVSGCDDRIVSISCNNSDIDLHSHVSNGELRSLSVKDLTTNFQLQYEDSEKRQLFHLEKGNMMHSFVDEKCSS